MHFFATGYFLNSTSTSVLSIPSFDEYDDALNTFQDTVDEFLTRSKSSGLTKIVIDLQHNTGGQALLAIDTFIRFFPNIKPFAGSRMRAHDATDVMGNTMTQEYVRLNTSDEAYSILAANEWVATSRINADTGANFSSWAEFYGPHLYNRDSFTTTVGAHAQSSTKSHTDGVPCNFSNSIIYLAQSLPQSQWAMIRVVRTSPWTLLPACWSLHTPPRT